MSRALTDKIIQHLCERVQNNELTNDEIINIIESLSCYLNLETISHFAKRKALSYNGVLKQIETGKLKTIDFFSIKFIVEND